jgi:carboxylate-amine ligase
VLSAPVSSRIDFAGSSRPTVGVEWEFALVDADTRDLSNEAAAVIAEIGENPHVHKELLRNTVEIVTGICENTGQAMDDLRSTLLPARRIVHARGMELFCAGTHPFAKWSAQKLTDAPRYAELIKRTQWWGRQMLIWGVHVHVGISSAHKVMPIVTSLLNHYPHLLALSASSPYWDGEDTGYVSNRAMMFQQLPTAGLPFHFQTWAQWEGFVHDQKKTGIIDHMNERLAQFMGMVETDRIDDPRIKLARSILSLFNPILYPGMGSALLVSQQELGELAGLSRQRTNAAIKALEEANLVQASYGSLFIRDLQALRNYAHGGS